MCDICVMNKVKDRMLSRRRFFTTSAGAAVSGLAVGASSIATVAAADGHRMVEDMTHELHETFPTYDGVPQFAKEQIFNWDEHQFNLFNLTINEHTGTHIDAPLHFSADGKSVSEIEISNLIAPLCVIDIKERAASDADAQVTPDDIRAWMARNGDIPARACVAMNSGWSAKVNTAGFRNVDSDGVQHYPGFNVEAVQMLMEETGAMSIAVDTLSLDHGMSVDFDTHYAWLPSGRFGIENIANLDNVPEAGATLVIGAPKFKGCSGGPARIFALV